MANTSSAEDLGAGGELASADDATPDKSVEGGKQAEAQTPAPIVAADGAVWHGVDEKKVRDKFQHYDKDGNGKLDAQEVVDLSVDLYHAFHPDKELTPEQINDVRNKLLQRMDERHGEHDGTVSFEEFLPWYALAAEKHWKMVHGLPHEPHDASGGISTPLDTPLQRKTDAEEPGKKRERDTTTSTAADGASENPTMAPRPAQLEIGAEGLGGSTRSVDESTEAFTARSTESSVAAGNSSGVASARRHRQRRKHTAGRGGGAGEAKGGGARGGGEGVGGGREEVGAGEEEQSSRLPLPVGLTPRGSRWLADSHAPSSIAGEAQGAMMDVSFGGTAGEESRGGGGGEGGPGEKGRAGGALTVPLVVRGVVGVVVGAMLLIFVGGAVAGTSRDEGADPLHPPAPLGRPGCSFYFCAGDAAYGFFSAGTVSSGVFSAASSVSIGVFSTGFASVGVVSVGFCSVGVVSVGVFSVGVVSAGHIVLGLWAWGTYAFYRHGGFSAHTADQYRYLGGNAVAYTAVLPDSAAGAGGPRPVAMDVENSLAVRGTEVREQLETAAAAMERSRVSARDAGD